MRIIFLIYFFLLPMLGHAAVKELSYPQPELILASGQTSLSTGSSAEIQKIELAALSEYADSYLRDFCQLRGLDECVDFTVTERSRLQAALLKENSRESNLNVDLLKARFRHAMTSAAKAYEGTLSYRNILKLSRLAAAVKNLEQKSNQYEKIIAEKERNVASDQKIQAEYVRENRFRQTTYVFGFCLVVVVCGLFYCLFKIV